MNKKVIRMTESDLHQVVKESVNRILKEAEMNDSVQALNKVYTLTEEILSIIEHYHEDFEHALGDNVSSAAFLIKKAHNLLKQDTNRNLQKQF